MHDATYFNHCIRWGLSNAIRYGSDFPAYVVFESSAGSSSDAGLLSVEALRSMCEVGEQIKLGDDYHFTFTPSDTGKEEDHDGLKGDWQRHEQCKSLSIGELFARGLGKSCQELTTADVERIRQLLVQWAKANAPQYPKPRRIQVRAADLTQLPMP